MYVCVCICAPWCKLAKDINALASDFIKVSLARKIYDISPIRTQNATDSTQTTPKIGFYLRLI